VPDAATRRPSAPLSLRASRPGGRPDLPVLAAVSAGGVLGALARYGLTSAFPRQPHTFPWTIFAINVSGCFLIGVLMVLVTETWRTHRLVRPFLGVGVLGGFTTFSTYIVDYQQTVGAGVARTGLAYLAGTLIAALAAVFAGVRLTRRITGKASS